LIYLVSAYRFFGKISIGVELLGMDHPRWCRGVAGGNPGNPENPESRDTCINMPISTHSSVTNLLHSSAHRSAPTQTPTGTANTPPPGVVNANNYLKINSWSRVNKTNSSQDAKAYLNTTKPHYSAKSQRIIITGLVWTSRSV